MVDVGQHVSYEDLSPRAQTVLRIAVRAGGWQRTTGPSSSVVRRAADELVRAGYLENNKYDMLLYELTPKALNLKDSFDVWRALNDVRG